MDKIEKNIYDLVCEINEITIARKERMSFAEVFQLFQRQQQAAIHPFVLILSMY